MAADDGESVGGDSLSELPLSSVGEADSLPSQLDIDTDAGLPGTQESLSQLPLSQEAVAPHTRDVIERPGVADAPVEEAGEVDSATDGDVRPHPSLGQRSLLAPRRGRRANPLLAEALREAMHEGPPQLVRVEGNVVQHDLVAQPLAPVSVESRKAAEAPRKRGNAADTMIAAEDRMQLIKKPRYGINPPSVLQAALLAAAACAKDPEAELDQDITRIGLHYLGASPAKIQSKEALAAQLEIDRSKLARAIPRLACSLVQQDLAQRSKAERAVLECCARQSLRLYLDFCAYDETPLQLALRGKAASAPAQSQQPSQHSSSSAVMCHSGQSALTTQLVSRSGVAKVVQTLQKGAMLIKVDDHFLAIVAPSLSPLCVIDDGSAPCLKAAQVCVSGVSQCSGAFAQKVRVACTDRYSANRPAELSLVQERLGHWDRLHLGCDVHNVSLCFTKTFSLMEANITGMLSCALSLQSSSAMDRFRASLKAEIQSRFSVRRGSPPQDAINHKKQLLTLFVMHGRRVSARQLLLVLCPNGDWRKPKVEFFPDIAAGNFESEEQMLDHVTTGLVSALCSCQPGIYPRHRWTGADLAVDALGVFEACHALLSTTYIRFARSYEQGAKAVALEASRLLLLQPDGRKHLAASDAAPVGAGESASEALLATDGGAPVAGASAAALGDSAPEPGVNWAEVNAARRRTTLQWLQQRPARLMIAQRIIMEPLRQLLEAHFTVAGQAWEEEQQSKLLRPGIAPPERLYRIGVAASGVDETRFSNQTSMLLHRAECWQALPIEAMTVGFRCLAYRMVSRMACCVEALLRQPHTKYPVKLFLLLARPELAPQLAGDPRCCMDSLTKSLLTQHPGFDGDEFRAKLTLLATVLLKDISVIESKHASVRRVLMQASLQVHPMSFKELSASWCFQQARKRLEMQSPASRRKVPCVPPLIACLVQKTSVGESEAATAAR